MAIRFPKFSEYLSRTTDVPAQNSFSMLAWCFVPSIPTDFQSIIGLYNGADNFDIEYENNTALRVYGWGTGAVFATQPTIGKPFVTALTGEPSGGLVTGRGYWRHLDSPVWETPQSVVFTAPAVTGISFGNFPPSPTFGFVGDLWGLKIWDRTLTADELLLESFYQAVKLPTSLNSHFLFDSVSDLVDRSGQGRDLTKTGTLSSSDATWRTWKPGARVLRRVAAATTIAPKIHQLRQQGFL